MSDTTAKNPVEGTNFAFLEAELQKGANAYRAFQEGVEVARMVRALNDQRTYLEAELPKLREQARVAVETTERAQADERTARRAVEDARVATETTITKAREAVDEIRSTGLTQANDLVRNAREEASGILIAAEQQRVLVLAQRDALAAEVAELESKLAQVREQAQALLGS